MTTPHPTHAGLQRDPEEWKTGDEPMTPAQRSYLETLCHDTGETFDANLTKAKASKMIDQLRERSPRLAGRELAGRRASTSQAVAGSRTLSTLIGRSGRRAPIA
jgi:hypothetical protein